MAISQITYSNTFSHWMVTTNQLVSVVNTLSFGDFYKNQGTLYLNSGNTGLYVSNSAIFGGNVTISGPVGSGTIFEVRNPTNIYNTLNVSGIITGTILKSDSTSSSINVFTSTATVNNSLTVANSTLLTGNTRITGNTVIVGNTAFVGNTAHYGITILNGGVILDGTLTSTGSIIADGTIDLTGNLNLTGDSTLIGNITSTGNTSFQGKTISTGNTSLSGDISTTGNTTVSGKNIISGNTSLTGNTTLTGNTSLSGLVTIAGNTALSGFVTIAGNTALSGNTVLTGNTILSGNTALSGNTSLSGNTVLTGNTALTGNTLLSGNTALTGNITVYDTLNIVNNKGILANGAIKSDIQVSTSNVFTDSLKVNTNAFFDTTTVRMKNSDGLSYNVITSKDLADANATIYRDIANTNQNIVSTNTYIQNYTNNTFVKFTGNPSTQISIPTLSSNTLLVDTFTVRPGGVFFNLGSTITDSSEYIFLYSTGSTTASNSQITVNRSGGGSANANAVLRWYNAGKEWQLRDVDNPTVFNKITTKNELDGANSFLYSYISNKFINATAFSSDVTISGNLIVNGLTTTINTNTLSIDDKNITLADISAITGLTFTCTSASPIVTLASTAGLIPGMAITKTSGGATPPGGTIILSVDSTTQITLTNNINTTSGTQFVGDIGGTTDATANAGGITIKGTTDKTFNWYNGTSAWTSSEHLALVSGKTIFFNGSTSGNTTVQPSAVASGTLTLSANTGVLISTGDIGTVTNAMLNGSIPNTKLANSSITIGSTNMALGTANTTIRGIVNLGLANNSNPANTVTLQVDNVGGNNTIIFPNKSGTVVLSGGGSGALGVSTLSISNTANPANTVTLIADNIGGNNTIIFPNQSGTVILSGGGGSGGASITSAMIVDGTIVDIDISPTAAISTSKLASNTISGVYLGSNLPSLANTSGTYAGILLSNTSYNGSKTEIININEEFVATSNANLSFFAVTTGTQLRSIVSSNTGTGNLVFDTNPTLVTPNIGAATGSSLVLSNDLYARNLFINGNTTVINTNSLSIDDKNITLGEVTAIAGITFTATVGTASLTTPTANTSGIIPGMYLTKTSGPGVPGTSAYVVSVDSISQITVSAVSQTPGDFVCNLNSASDFTANNGGITLKGTTDHTIIYSNTAFSNAGAWQLSENLEVVGPNRSININGSFVANSTYLGALSGNNVTNVTAIGLAANSAISSYREKVVSGGTITSSFYNLDVSSANIYDITLGINTTITLIGYNTTSGWARPITLIVRQPVDSNGSTIFKTLSVNNSIFTDGIKPILSKTANAVDVLTFWSVDGGTSYFGTFAMADVR